MKKETYQDIALGVVSPAALGAKKLFGGKSKPIDISQQLSQVRSAYDQAGQRNAALPGALNPLTQDYKAGLKSALTGAREGFETERTRFMDETDATTKGAQDAMRANLYSDTFSALPDALRSVREASAAGGGLNTGSYQQAVKETGVDTARQLIGGERDIQIAGAEHKQQAQQQAFNAFNELSSRLNAAEMDGLVRVMDTGREDLIRQYTTQMGFDIGEAQAVIDLMNFKQSGQMAQSQAADANKMALLTALISGGTKIASAGMGA